MADKSKIKSTATIGTAYAPTFDGIREAINYLKNGGAEIGKFAEMKIIENEFLPDNEIILMCGKESYRFIVDGLNK